MKIIVKSSLISIAGLSLVGAALLSPSAFGARPAPRAKQVRTPSQGDPGSYNMFFNDVSAKIHQAELNELLSTFSREFANLGQQHAKRMASPAKAGGAGDDLALRRDALIQKGKAACDLLATLIPIVEIEIGSDGAKIRHYNAKPIIAGRPESLLVKVATPGGKWQVEGAPENTVKISPGEVRPMGGEGSCALIEARADKSGAHKTVLRFLRGDGRAVDAKFDLKVAPGGVLEISILDATSNERCPARVTVTGADGRQYIPEGYETDKPCWYDYAYGYFYAEGAAKIVVPAGKAQVRLERGFEYEPSQTEVAVSESRSARAECRISRWTDMVAKGWYSVDSHLHYVKLNWRDEGDCDFLDMKKRAEDINVGNVLPLMHWWHNPEFVGVRSNTYPARQGLLEKYSKGRYVTCVGEEFRNDSYYGHLVIWNIKKLVEPVSTGWMGGPDQPDYPSNTQVARRVHKFGGLVGPAHDIVQETPVMAALGEIDLVDIHAPDKWYDLLNCGFRLPCEIGSDYPANKMGFERAYVYTGSPEFDWKQFIKSLKGGRTFVSSGAMISFDAGGKIPGDVIRVNPGAPARIHIKVCAQWLQPLQRLEIVHNGKVIHQVKPDVSAKTLEFEGEIEVPGKGWIAARCSANQFNHWWPVPGIAHTSPIYIEDGTGPYVSVDSARAMKGMSEDTLKKALAGGKFNDDKQKEEVTRIFEKGIACYERLIAGADGR